MKETLMDITGTLDDLLTQLHEADPEEVELIETLQQCIEEYDGKFEDKAKKIAFFIRRLEADEVYNKAEIQRLQKRNRTFENKRESMKEYLRMNMNRLGLKKIHHPDCDILVQNHKPKVVIHNDYELPSQYKKEIIEYKIDKKQLYDDYKAGKEIPGVTFEHGQHLSIR